ncbi:MAG: hypothetical protein R6U21_03340 [Thermoplasmatota archaeon]
MNIKNIQLKGIEAHRYSDLQSRPQKVRIDHNSNINRMERIDKEQARIDFQYTASYGAVGMIKIEGSLMYIGGDAHSLVDNWNDSHKMPNKIASGIHTAVMHACVPQAVGIAKDLRLPPPIPLPQVRLGDSAKKGKAQAGPEVA